MRQVAEQQEQENDVNFKQIVGTVALATAAVGATAGGGGYSLAAVYDGAPTVHFNRHPKEIYEVTLTIYDAPGPLKPEDGNIIYIVSNTQCIPNHLLNESGEPSFDYSQGAPLRLNWINKKIGTVYKTYVAEDFMANEDYYGKGVCNWVINYFDLYVNNNKKDKYFISFNSGIHGAEIKSGKEVKTYFLKDNYIHPENATLIGTAFIDEDPKPGSGQSDSSITYGKIPESERSKYFYTTLSVKKVKPRPSLQRWIWLQYAPDSVTKRRFQ